MSSNFSMDDYVDVAQRIREFSEKYPDGSLQSELKLMVEPDGWLCVARAYRTPDDQRPGIGHAFEPVPGKTPYTKDSEAMNAETSAWGRAIVALGFNTKKIASRQEVAARGASDRVADDAHGLQASRADAGANGAGASDKQKAMIRRLAKKLGLDAADVDSLSKKDASARIEELLAIEAGTADAVAVGGGVVEDDIPF